MEREPWMREYRRLTTAYGKSLNLEQADAYFAALGHYPGVAVAEAVTLAIRESRGWPSAAELAERAANYLKGHQAPAGACDVCHGERFTQHVCHEGLLPNQINQPHCLACRCFHEKARGPFTYCRPCYQCHPAARTSDPAA